MKILRALSLSMVLVGALAAGCASKPATSSTATAETASAEKAATEKAAEVKSTGEAKAAETATAKVAEAPAIELPNGHVGLGIATAGQPTLDQLKQAKALGYKTVVNLRTADEPGVEKQADVEALGLGYVSIPVAGEAGVTEENARALAAVLGQTEKLPAVVHCGSANRAGALLALKAFYVDGKSAAEALEVGKTYGLTKLEALVKEKLAKAEAERAAKK